MIKKRGVTIVLVDPNNATSNIYIYDDNVITAEITQEISELASELPISNFTLKLKNIVNIINEFAIDRLVQLWLDGRLRMVANIVSVRKDDYNAWTVEGEDYISKLDKTVWYGREYGIKRNDTALTDKYLNITATELLKEIFTSAGVPYIIDESFDKIKVVGELGITTCRDAVLNICFAAGAICDTSSTPEYVHIRKLSNSKELEIDPGRVYGDVKVTTPDKVSRVGVVAYNKRGQNAIEKEKIEETERTGWETGDVFEYFFTTPRTSYGLYWINSEGKEVQRAGFKVLDSSLYHLKWRYVSNSQPNVNAYIKAYNLLSETNGEVKWEVIDDDPNGSEILVDTATLVNKDNVQEVLSRISKAAKNNTTVTCKIATRRGTPYDFLYKYGEAKYAEINYGQAKKEDEWLDNEVELGDMLTLEIPNHGKITKRLVRQKYTLGNGILVKECTLK